MESVKEEKRAERLLSLQCPLNELINSATSFKIKIKKQNFRSLWGVLCSWVYFYFSYAMEHMWRLENNFGELILTFYLF